MSKNLKAAEEIVLGDMQITDKVLAALEVMSDLGTPNEFMDWGRLMEIATLKNMNLNAEKDIPLE